MNRIVRRVMGWTFAVLVSVAFVPCLAYADDVSTQVGTGADNDQTAFDTSVSAAYAPLVESPFSNTLRSVPFAQTVSALTLYELDGSEKGLTTDYGDELRVVIVGRPACGNTLGMVEEALELSTQSAYSAIRFIVLDVDDDRAVFTDAFADEQTDRVRFASPVDGSAVSYNSWAWRMWRGAGNMGSSVTSPFAFLIDEQGNVLSATTGYQSLVDLVEDHFGIIDPAYVPVTMEVEGTFQQTQARMLLSMVNEARSAVGVSALKWDAALEATALQRAAEQSVYYSHTRPDGSGFYTAFTVGTAMGENIAWGQIDANEVNEDWTNSPGHYANMIGTQFTSMAAASFTAPNGRVFWVEVFSNSAGADDFGSDAVDGDASMNVQVSSEFLGEPSMVDTTLNVGQTALLKVNAGENARVAASSFDWAMSNDAVATVSEDGVVTGVAPGTAVVTASFKTKPTVFATATVTVTASTSPDPDPDPDPDPSPDPDPDNPDPDDPGSEAVLERIAGADYAYQTSAKISEEAFPEGSDWVVLARDDDFADAMSATGLAGALDAPIVLTDRFGLSTEAADEIKRLGATSCYIIGGTGAMPGGFESQLAALGLTTVERVYGSESWDTSVACADRIAKHNGNANHDAIVAMSLNFQDALSISSFAYKYAVPIYLQTAEGDRPLPQAAISAISELSGTIYVPGGTGAVRESTVEGVFSGRTIVRMFGESGYDTSNQIATYMVQNGKLSADTVCVACGAEKAKGSDALSGAALAGKLSAPMLLVNSNEAMERANLAAIEGNDSSGTQAFLTANASGISQAYILGGYFVVPEALEDTIEGILQA